MLSLTSPREILFAFPPSPPLNLLFFTVESTLSFTSSSFDLPLFRQGAVLAHVDFLPFQNLVVRWLCFFPFGKCGSGILANCSLCGIEAILFFSADPISSSFSAEACATLQALCWSQQHKQVCHFSFLLFSLTIALLSLPSFILTQSLWQIWRQLFCFSSCSLLSSYNGSPDTPFSWVTTLLVRPAALCSFSPFTSSIHSFLFLDWRRTVSSRFFNTQVPSVSTEELVLPRHARCVLSRLCCNKHFLKCLVLYLFRIGRIENSSCSASGHSSQDTSHFILHCPATDSWSLYNLWSRP